MQTLQQKVNARPPLTQRGGLTVDVFEDLQCETHVSVRRARSPYAFITSFLAQPKAGWLIVLNLLATLQIVWFYLNRVPSYLHLECYEQGVDRMPFQGRILMEIPLRWAHSSPLLIKWASILSRDHVWLSRGVRPEAFVELIVNFWSVVVAGVVARYLYRRFSPRGVLTQYVYPLVLMLVTFSYCVTTIHMFRYVYDLPGLGLFAVGLYAIASRRHWLLFVAIFVVATVNRETSLLLLIPFIINRVTVNGKIERSRLRSLSTWMIVTAMAVGWTEWYLWIHHRFAHLPSESAPRLWANVVTLMWPFAWAQLAAAGGFLLLPTLAYAKGIAHPEFRLWLWMVPAAIALMLYFGLLIEVRIFGELIPVLACAACLLAEQQIVQNVARSFGQVASA